MADNQVFDVHSHDAMEIEEGDTDYLVTGTTSTQRLYRSETPTGPASWTLEDENYLDERFEFDSLIRVEDRYLAYGNSDVYVADSP